MEKFDNGLGVTAVVTTDKLKIEVSITGLVNAFNRSPGNPCEMTVKRGQKHAFAKLVAEGIIDVANAETGDSYVVEMFDKFFEQLFDGSILADDVINDPVY